MSDIQNATIQGMGGLDQSIACVMLGYTVRDAIGQTHFGPVPDRLARLAASKNPADQALHASCLALIAENVPKVEKGPLLAFAEPDVNITSESTTEIYEAGNTVIRLAPIRDRDAFRAQTVTTGNQDGGNGSGGGDVASSAHSLSMVRSDADTTFWKIDSPPIKSHADFGASPGAGISSLPSVGMMNLRTAPNLARVFSSHASAMNYRVTNAAALDALFDIVLIVAVAVHSEIRRPIVTAGGVDA